MFFFQVLRSQMKYVFQNILKLNTAQTIELLVSPDGAEHCLYYNTDLSSQAPLNY